MNHVLLPHLVRISGLVSASIFAFAEGTKAQVYEKLYSFTDARAAEAAATPNKGSDPRASLVQGNDGNFYGTTFGDGSNNHGTVFRVSADGTLTNLVMFTGNGTFNKGGGPSAELLQGSDGNFYGTTFSGGASDLGTIFKMTIGGVLTTLVEFTGNDTNNKGSHPQAGIVQNSDGYFYGTTREGGGSGLGTIFKLTAGGMLTTLVEFTGNEASNKGSGPTAGLTRGSDGNFYGTTDRGGAADAGTAFKMTPAGVLTTLVEFTGNGASNKGSFPRASLLQGSDGDFYGTTSGGGASGHGTAFKMTPGGALTTLVEFSGNGGGNKGSMPLSRFVEGNGGSYYGTTKNGGASDNGTIFRVTSAGVLTTLVEFTFDGTTNKGSLPPSGLVRGSDGNFYGTTSGGGSSGDGTVFRLSAGGVLTTLVEFTGTGSTNKGVLPYAGLVRGSDGNFYGTTHEGGAYNLGTVFKLTPAGVMTTLVEFTGNGPINSGGTPLSGVIQGSDGNFYGTTFRGGVDDVGTVFKMTPTGVLTTLIEFISLETTIKGRQPIAGLVQGSDGSLYGTTQHGGSLGAGTVFKVTTNGVLTTLVNFTGNGVTNKGYRPRSRLVEGSDGNFYGTTEDGGVEFEGTIFKMTPAGVLTTLVEFVTDVTSNEDYAPQAGLMQASDGNFYGMTSGGGTSGKGTIFKMTSAGQLTTLVQFTGNGTDNKGSDPRSSMVQGRDGNLYGTTLSGGASGLGTVFKLTPDGILTTLVEFTGNGATNKGGGAYAGLVMSSDGSFYGTSLHGGGTDLGTAYKVTAEGSLTTLAEFQGDGTTITGSSPLADLVQDSAGNLFGTTESGGANGLGTVFKLTPAGVLMTLVEFTGNGTTNKGRAPHAELVLGSDGNLYGTTRGGGSSDYGTVFKVTPTGLLTTLVEFKGYYGSTLRGAWPYTGLTKASDGNFYGTTWIGGSGNAGTIFKMTPAGALTTLVNLTNSSPLTRHPFGGMTQGGDGNFYGTVAGFAGSDYGAVYRMTTGGTLTRLLGFTGNGTSNKGSDPAGRMIQDSGGIFYGTTREGGTSNFGTVFKMTTGGVLTTMVEFTGTSGGNKGSYPHAGLVQANDGDFYGTTLNGGTFDHGTVFKMTASGVLTTLVEFAVSEEGNPAAGLILGTDGNLYGTTGGPDGSIYRLIFPGAPWVAISTVELQGNTSAMVQARINARGTATTAALEYGTDGINFPNNISVAVNVNGYQTVLAGAILEALSPGTTYYCRFRAVSSAGTTTSPVTSFSTLAAPVVAVSPATEIAPTSARLNGTVNAQNFDSTSVFQWGTDGNSFPNTAISTPVSVTGNATIPVSVAVAGLVKGTTYFYRISATNPAGTVVSGTQSFSTLADPTATIGGSFALSTTSVRVEGAANAQGSDASVVFEYGTDGVSFPNSVAATPGAISGETNTPVSAVLTTLSQGVTYHYRIKATSAGGTGISTSNSFSMNVLSGFTQVFPAPPPSSEGFLIVNLTPAGILHGWRFLGEQQWRPSGVPVGGLATGDHTIEFRPVPGWNHPPTEEAVPVISGEVTTFTAPYYHAAGSSVTAGLSVVLKPDAITTGAERAQWRLLGEGDTLWRDSGATISDLIPGNYLVECKPVPGRTTPPNVNVVVSAGPAASPTITYFIADAVTGAAPTVLAYESVTGDTAKPYAFVGQLRSDVGAGSGFAVKQRVVATAAHVVWNDGTLTAAQGLQWLFQRHRGLHEPKPLLPRGFYLFDTYSSQRQTEATPGFFSPQSQHLDVAAIYFTESAGRGGYGGYLASDLAQNEFLLSSANKMLVGYPIDGIAATSQGRMHAASPFNVGFSPGFGRTFTTTALRAIGGNSGGPLCVQFEGGSYYPAAICLGGSGQMVVRAIDSAVVDLFNRAEISGNGGGGVVTSGGSLTTIIHDTTSDRGSIQVIIQPAQAAAIAAWGLSPDSPSRPSTQTVAGRLPGDYIVKFATIPGFQPPVDQTVPVKKNETAVLTYTYALPLSPQETWRQTHFGSTANTGDGADGNDFDHDGFTNVQEYTAGTNPTLNGDFFKAENPQRSGGTFSLSTAGKAGRTYVLERSITLAPGSWTTVDSEGPLAADAPVTLTDAASPPGVAFFRIRVTGP